MPLVGRVIPVIEDDYVDIEFGTGCLKVTPAHDVNDYMLGEKYNLTSIDIFNDDGTLSEAAGLYVGLDRFDVRKQIEGDLAEAGLLEKVEAYTNKVGFSERTDVPIEPQALDAVVPEDEAFRRLGSAAGHERRDKNSIPQSTKTPTGTGWKTSRTGASAVSFGGDTAYRLTTCRKEASSWPRQPKRPCGWPKKRRATRRLH